jgi:ubiquinone biosynthesis protein Coq4
MASTETTRPTLHPEFVKSLVRTFNDPDEHGVHMLFNEWWAHAPDATIAGYLTGIRATPGADTFLEARFFAPQTTLEELEAMPAGTVGHGYYDFLTKNGLEKNLATNYRMLHDFMANSGQLDRMPDDLRYAIIRGFQIHDLLHVVTGYTPHGLDELALQAFCLAQLQFPYFGMWMSTSTTRMAFLEPAGIVPVMDAISSGWQLGRSVSNLQFERWEEVFGEPLATLRSRHGLPAEGVTTHGR